MAVKSQTTMSEKSISENRMLVFVPPHPLVKHWVAVLRNEQTPCPIFSCTPLHWAVIRGHVEACAVLVHAGTKQELSVKDNAGFTPVQLASDKGHQHIALFLSNAQNALSKHWVDKVCIGRLRDIGYAHILFCLIFINTILFINSVLFAPDLPKVTAILGLWGWTAVSVVIAALMMFYRCSRRRLEKRIYIPLPNFESRKELIRINLRTVEVLLRE